MLCMCVCVKTEIEANIFVCDFEMDGEEKGFEWEWAEKFCLERKLIGILIIYEKRNFTENGDVKSKCKKKKQSSICKIC